MNTEQITKNALTETKPMLCDVLFDAFIKKWVGVQLYTTAHDYRGLTTGKIIKQRRDNYQLAHYKNVRVVADVLFIPTWHGFENDKQRRSFYKEAKKAGFSSNKTSKCEWYKIVDMVSTNIA